MKYFVSYYNVSESGTVSGFGHCVIDRETKILEFEDIRAVSELIKENLITKGGSCSGCTILNYKIMGE